jgi:hypothetical protein
MIIAGKGLIGSLPAEKLKFESLRGRHGLNDPK